MLKPGHLMGVFVWMLYVLPSLLGPQAGSHLHVIHSEFDRGG